MKTQKPPISKLALSRMPLADLFDLRRRIDIVLKRKTR